MSRIRRPRGSRAWLLPLASSLALVALPAPQVHAAALDAAGVDVALVDVTLVDVGTGVGVPHTTVVVADGVVRAVGPSGTVAIPGAATRIDGRGAFLVPGLWDLHAHVLQPGAEAVDLPLLVAHGVLGARDMHSPRPLREQAALRAAIADGRTVGPRLLLAGSLVDGPQRMFRAPLTVHDAADARDAVDALADAGMDFVKPYDALDARSFLALATAGRDLHLGFAGHVPVAIDARDAARELDSIEHLSALLVASARDADAVRDEARARLARGDDDAASAERWLVRLARAHDAERMRALAADLAKTGVCVTPTLVVGGSDGRSRRRAAVDDALRFVPRARRERWLDDVPWWRTAGSARRFDVVRAAERSVVRTLHAAGVPLLAGTDVGSPFLVPGASLHDELQALVAAGLPPLEALRAATTNARRCLGARAGSAIAPGERAEMVLLDADPLVDVAATRRIRAVVTPERVLDRAALDALLARVERDASR